MKKKFFAEIELYIMSMIVMVCGSAMFVVFAIVVNKNIGIFAIITFLLCYIIFLLLGYKLIEFETNYILYKKSFFSKKIILKYSNLKKIFIDYTGFTVSYYKGAKPRIVLYFLGGYVISTDIRYGILWNLIKNIPKDCNMKIVLRDNDLRLPKHIELLKDYLTKKQKDQIERLIAKKQAKRKKRSNK